MKKVILLFLILKSVNVYSINIIMNDNREYTFTNSFINSDKVNVRAKPEIKKDNILDVLNIGQKVSIIKISEKTYTQDNITNFWYKIEYFKENIKKTGYIWGNYLSLYDYMINDKKLLFSIKSYNRYKGYKLELNLITEQCVIFRFNYYLYIDNDNQSKEKMPKQIEIEILENVGLTEFDKIIKIQIQQDADGITTKRPLIAIKDNNIFFIAEEEYWGEGAVGNYYKKYIFPNEKGGKPGVIIYQYQKQIFDEKISKDITVKNEQFECIWQDGSLIKIK